MENEQEENLIEKTTKKSKLIKDLIIILLFILCVVLISFSLKGGNL